MQDDRQLLSMRRGDDKILALMRTRLEQTKAYATVPDGDRCKWDAEKVDKEFVERWSGLTGDQRMRSNMSALSTTSRSAHVKPVSDHLADLKVACDKFLKK